MQQRALGYTAFSGNVPLEILKKRKMYKGKTIYIK